MLEPANLEPMNSEPSNLERSNFEPNLTANRAPGTRKSALQDPANA
jgi:hypothetical protein